jgi:hypothetical protein
MTDFRALCAELADELDAETGYTKNDGERIVHPTVALARIALAQPEQQRPSDKELLELMPESMRDEFSYAARVCSDAMGRRVKPGIFRVALNSAALEYARAVYDRAILDRWAAPRATHKTKEYLND